MNDQIQRTEQETIQEQASGVSVDVDVKGERDIAGADTLHGELDEMADSFGVSGFKCVHDECGLVHGHATDKHRGSDSFDDVSEEDAASMEANPNCHCGLNEAARTGVKGAPTPSKANNMAPIPDTMTRHLDSTF